MGCVNNLHRILILSRFPRNTNYSLVTHHDRCFFIVGFQLTVPRAAGRYGFKLVLNGGRVNCPVLYLLGSNPPGQSGLEVACMNCKFSFAFPFEGSSCFVGWSDTSGSTALPTLRIIVSISVPTAAASVQ